MARSHARVPNVIQLSRSKDPYEIVPLPIFSVSAILLLILLISTLSSLIVGINRGHPTHPLATLSSTKQNYSTRLGSQTLKTDISRHVVSSEVKPSIQSLRDLTPSEIHPQAGPTRYIVSPPPDKGDGINAAVTLVTCTTTVGNLHILVHLSWAPNGASRFLQMVKTGYFSSKVALMRCIENFLCQFGIAGDPSFNAPYEGRGKNLKDDPNWLPEGPTHRTNELGVKRFGKGYLAYAGAGPNSRGNQFIVALEDNERLGGGSPWEVPWGELVSKESYDTLDKIYTGYGENGPSQGRLNREGSSEGVKKDFPKLDYILGCNVVDSM